MIDKTFKLFLLVLTVELSFQVPNKVSTLKVEVTNKNETNSARVNFETTELKNNSKRKFNLILHNSSWFKIKNLFSSNDWNRFSSFVGR